MGDGVLFKNLLAGKVLFVVFIVGMIVFVDAFCNFSNLIRLFVSVLWFLLILFVSHLIGKWIDIKHKTKNRPTPKRRRLLKGR